MELVFLALGWGLFCVIHSALITNKAVRFFSARLGGKAGYYRLLYNVIAAILLVPLVWYEHTLQGGMTPWFPDWWPLRLLFLLIATVFFITGGRQYDALSFLGIAQIRSGRTARTLSSGSDLVTTGVLAWVRHPWYTGVFFLLAARPLTPVSLTSNLVLFVYLIIGTMLEERRVVGEFGDAYRDYQARVPMFIPWTLGGRLFR